MGAVDRCGDRDWQPEVGEVAVQVRFPVAVGQVEQQRVARAGDGEPLIRGQFR
jgi:hypothetical protein